MANETARLTRLFRRWAHEHLAYGKLEARMKIHGRNPVREYTVGMRAERLDRRFVLGNRLGWGTLIGAIALKNLAESPAMTVGALDAANSLFALAVLTLAIAALVRSKTRTYAWIEFRPDADPLTRATVERTRQAAAHVRSNPDATWVPAKVLLVSGEKGFYPDAVALADSEDIA
ncbi:MAG TPA: hypothetical protein VF395_20855, partial [Polyangiaceae bacterium]